MVVGDPVKGSNIIFSLKTQRIEETIIEKSTKIKNENAPLHILLLINSYSEQIYLKLDFPLIMGMMYR